MKYVSEFRDPTLARHLAQKLADAVQPGRPYRFMEFCWCANVKVPYPWFYECH